MTLVGGSNHGSLLMRTRNRRRFTDLNARSGETEVHKAMVVNGTPSSAVAVTIVVDDDDDDVVVSSPRSFNQVGQELNIQEIFSTIQLQCNQFQQHLLVEMQPAKSNVSRLEVTGHSVVQVQDDPLELRLGPGGSDSSAFRIRSISGLGETQPRYRRTRPIRPTVDLTSPFGEDCVVLNVNPQNRKRREPVPIERPKEKEKELKLMCAICMDTMKMETSTVCGHIFCQSCIQGAIQAQKKCPTCRRKLLMKDIHRIYIQSSTD